MVFERGFFQADPHPGNIFVMKNNMIGLVDFGMTGKLTQANIKKFSYLVLSFMEKDLDINVEEYRLLGIVSEDEENVEFEKEAIMMMERYRRFPLDKINMGNVIYELSDLARKYGFTLNKDFVLLGKVFFTVESVIREIDPDFNFVEAAKPHALKFLKESARPGRLLNDAKSGALSIFSFFKTLPKDIGEIFKKIKKGELEIEFVHVGLEPLIRELDRATNRLAAAFIIGALIIGSSIITYSGVGPIVLGMPLYGSFGYMLAAILGFALVISIMRSGKL
jgi:ubiquinone biosynthesis protein